MDRRNFWDWFLGREPKETLSYVEFENARLDNPLLKKLEEDVARFKRTRREMDEVFNLSKDCGRIMSKYMKDLPDEDVVGFFLAEGWTAYLPISIRPFLKLWESGPGRVGSLTPHID